MEQKAAAAADDPPSFAAFLGYEWTGSFPWDKHWPVKEGHVTVIFPGHDESPCPAQEDRCRPLSKLIEFESKRHSFFFQHHSIAAWASADVLLPDDSTVPVIEIASSHGSSECLDCPNAMADRVSTPGHTVQDALAGRRLGFIGGSDNHNARPGARHFSGKAHMEMDAGGATCVLAESNTRDAILEAMRARHCYATTSERILLDFRIDQTPMGGIAPSGASVDISYHVNGTVAISKIEILRGDLVKKVFEVVRTVEPKAPDSQDDWKDPRPPDSAVYYLRVTQSDGAMARSSPIWTSR